MPLPANYIRASLVSLCDNQQLAVNILWYTTTQWPAPEEAQATVTAYAAAISSTFADPLQDLMAVDSAYTGCEVSLSINNTTFVASSVFGAGPGNNSGDSAPSYAAAIIQKRTAQPGKSGRGRWFIGPLAEVLTDGQRLNTTGEDQINELAALLGAPVTGEAISLAPQHLMNDSVLQPIIGVRPLLTLGTMRRRMVRPRF